MKENSIVADTSNKSVNSTGSHSSIIEEKSYDKDHISPLRDTEIRTVHGIGYRLEGNIKKRPEESAIKSITPPPEL